MRLAEGQWRTRRIDCVIVLCVPRDGLNGPLPESSPNVLACLVRRDAFVLHSVTRRTLGRGGMARSTVDLLGREGLQVVSCGPGRGGGSCVVLVFV